MQFPYYYTPVAGNYSPAERDAMFNMIRNADTPGNLASYNDVLALAPRPNLLDNAYFVGGGTGYGIFPVNQRGVTQYSGGGAKVFDRWAIGAGGGAVELLSSGAKISCSNNQNIYQRLTTRPADLLNKTLTLSFLDSNGNLYKGTGTAPSVLSGGNIISIDVPDFGTAVFAYSTSTALYYVAFLGQTGSQPITLVAAKLERGSVQTIAHQENGAWVLNSIPRYADELRKCQAYLQIIKPTGTERCLLGSGYVDSGTNAKRALFTVPLSAPMRPITSVTSTGVGVIQTGVGNKNIEAIALFCQTSTLATLNATLTTAISSPSYAALTAYVLNSGSVTISAEL